MWGGDILLKIFKKEENDDKGWVEVAPSSWNPDVGDRIEGYLTRFEADVGKYNQNLYELTRDDSSKILIWGKTHLDSLLSEVELNDYIRITYMGIKKTANGHDLKTYMLEKRCDNNGY